MLPSLIAGELRAALSGYLGTTFALADDDVRERLEGFLGDPTDGIFRGPYVRLRLPFQPATEGWQDSLDWAPVGFSPYRHQAQAFERLSSKHRRPLPTLVTTGTGSGKTESFLIPLLDHCRRARAAGQHGIKALLLYPMNALANDQARRIAAMIDDHADDLGGVTAALYTGDSGTATRMTADSLIEHKREIRDNPPDILLTNYKMLDFLLLRPEDSDLWATSRHSLQYVVLDEFHTYDGAQGTDVAMLLRRLGMALGVSEPGRPLGRITPVATSATLGDGGRAGGKLLGFAGKVFGEPFDEEAVVGEQRMGADEWLADAYAAEEIVYDELPLLERVPPVVPGETHVVLLNAVADAFFRNAGNIDAATPDHVTDRHGLGLRLMRHPLTRRLLEEAPTPRDFGELVREVAPQWVGRREAAENAISAFLALLSHARTGDRPLLQVDIQLWIREVSRVDRRVSSVPEFHWGMDGSRTDVEDRYLPAIYCRHCGRSGWGTARRSRDVALEARTQHIRQQSVRKTGRFRALIHAPGELRAGDLQQLNWLDPITLELSSTKPDNNDGLPVLATPDDDAARRDRCPSCGLDEGIRFLGSRVATLTSVSLGHLFGSQDVEPEQKKTLVFTDSVQDAAHRAGFIESRSYALNFRALLVRAIGSGRTTLAELDSALLAAAKTPDERYALLPPEMASDVKYKPFWEEKRSPSSLRTAVKKRAAFSAILEFGLNARTGRTLELTGTATAHVEAGSPEKLARIAAAVVAEHKEERPHLELPVDGVNSLAWIRGVLERMRLQGGINHQWLTKYISEDGNRWSIWGGRPEEMPAFPSGRPAPAFPTTAARSEAFDSVVARGTWYSWWTSRCLKIPESEAPLLVRALFETLHAEHVVSHALTKSGVKVYYLEPDTVAVDPVHQESAADVLRCDVCSLRFPGVREITGQLADGPCLRNRCSGTLRAEVFDGDYYRGLYSSGRVRRISAHEHTGLLDAETRVSVEKAFKGSPTPNAPNVLTCTPTLELGIDIGDLSVVGLTSLPRSVAGYLQRVGRAGRQTGSALVFAVLPGQGIELHWLAEPLDMIDGEVVPPACHLDAAEIIRRQYFASLIDRAARTHRGKPPRTAGKMLSTALVDGSWMRDLLHDGREHAVAYVDEFLSGFRGHVAPDTEVMLADWAGVGLGRDEVSPMERDVEQAIRTWLTDMAELQARAAALSEERERVQAQEALLDDVGKRDLNRLRGEHRAATSQINALRRQYWVTALESMGLLPNYTLLDDRTTLDVGLTWTDERTGQSAVERSTYERGSQVALHELAPGSTFYVNGSALNVDAVDLGSVRNPKLLRWRFCPACGWSAQDTGPTRCPRCQDNRAADTGQLVTAVRFRKASAFASRDGARFGDEDEERKRLRFTVAAAIDVPQQEITKAWGLRDYPFGAEFARTADIRWINLGRADTGGAERIIAGETIQAPLFDACKHCGVVPAAQPRVHDRADARHRGWCPQRHHPDPDDWVQVALLHELRTQVVRLLVPPIVIADETLLHSMRAALLLGLRKILGGEPDHLDVLVAPDPGSHGRRHLLVLHDRVPGGTGYLAQFADPDEVRSLLTAAAGALAECKCAAESVAACHRCLLPYVPPSAVQLVRRDRALELLRDILAKWVVHDLTSLRAITVSPHETPLELRFRALLNEWAKKEKAEPRISPAAGGDQLTFRLNSGNSAQTWTLTAQPRLGYVQPDFVLSADDPSIPKIAVFCDGQSFHASAEHNRLADDAEKRAGLRAEGYLVWAVTHDDLDVFAQAVDGDPATGLVFLTGEQHQTLRRLAGNPKLFGPNTVAVADLGGDAVSQLTHFLCRPDENAWSGPATALALALTGASKRDAVRLSDADVVDALAAAIRGESVKGSAEGRSVLQRRSAGAATTLIDVEQPAAVRVYLGVDDRPETIAGPENEQAWRDWLALSNLLQFLDDGRFSAGTSSSPLPGADRMRRREDSAQPTIDIRWRPLLGEFGPKIDLAITELSRHDIPIPEPGHEAADGDFVIDLAWPRHQVAVLVDEDPETRDALVDNGWSVFGPDEVGEAAAAVMKGDID
ncbi:DEAD/DEAH box helicase [Actinosynnema sp. NPDC023587]|uniref:DEAD/DEAH box helicase n=1 Tax=Actinosynnema sp. NPDC023587 TaxID=3154695 RepID=UPI00340AB903